MNKVPVKDLKEGHIFSAPVYIDGNNLFVAAGIPVRKKDIARLNFLAIESVVTEGKLVDALLENGAEENVNTKTTAGEVKDKAPVPGKHSIVSLPEVHENKGAYRSYMDLVERLDDVCSKIAAGTAVEAHIIDGITGQLLQAVRDQRQS